MILLNKEIKSFSLKVLPIKHGNQRLIIKGLKIYGFEKLITNKYASRNIDFPKYVTDRLKKMNGSLTTSNSNRYINTSNIHKIILEQNQNKKIEKKM